MEPKEHIRKNLKDCKFMQLATAEDNQPWVCTVHYIVDDQMNVYWLSFPSRRHSQEIAKNQKVAIAVAVKFDQPVIGIQAEGRAEVVSEPSEIKKIIGLYVTKFGIGKKFYDNFVAGKNEHSMYRLAPTKFVLFDEGNFPGKSPLEWRP